MLCILTSLVILLKDYLQGTVIGLKIGYSATRGVRRVYSHLHVMLYVWSVFSWLRDYTSPAAGKDFDWPDHSCKDH